MWWGQRGLGGDSDVLDGLSLNNIYVEGSLDPLSQNWGKSGQKYGKNMEKDCYILETDFIA